MDRRLGIALAVALGVALFAIAYLLGRESARGTPAVVVLTPAPVGTAVGAENAPTVAPGLSGAPETPSSVTSTTTASAELAATPASVEPIPPTAPSAPASDPGMDAPRADVARYFAELEALQHASKSWTGDPNAAAQQILRDAVGGNTQGLDGLIDGNQRLLQQIRALETPAPCLPHRQATVEALEAANGLLVKMRAGIQAGDMSSLALMTSEGQALERAARQADALAADVKKRYGL